MKRVCHIQKIFLCRGLYWKKFHKISKTPSLKNVPAFCCHKKSFLAIWAVVCWKGSLFCSLFVHLELPQLPWPWHWVCECSVLVPTVWEAPVRPWPVQLRPTQDPFLFFLNLPLSRWQKQQGACFDGQYFVLSCQLNPLVTWCSCEWSSSFQNLTSHHLTTQICLNTGPAWLKLLTSGWTGYSVAVTDTGVTLTTVTAESELGADGVNSFFYGMLIKSCFIPARQW